MLIVNVPSVLWHCWFGQTEELRACKESECRFVDDDILTGSFARLIVTTTMRDAQRMLASSGMQALSEIVQTRRLRLAGHVLRLPDVRPARIAMTWIPESGWRTSGRPQMTWRTSFKEDLHWMNLTWHGARRAADDWHRWRNLVAQCRVRDRRN